VNGSDGYDALTVEFDDFQNGETFAFSVDNDPTSIQDASGTGAAGSVSGLELAGSTVTVTYADGSSQTTSLASDGSDGGAQATAKTDVPAAPSIDGVQGVTLDGGILDGHHSGATVADTQQTVQLSGPAGGTVELLRIEGQLQLDQATGYEVEALEANDAVQVETQTVALNGSGQATVDVTLTNSTSQGGYNYFVATMEDGDGDTGETSNVVVLKHEPSAGEPQVLHRVNVGESTTLSALDDGPDWTGVTGTGSPYLVSVGGPNGEGTYCGGDEITPTSAVPSTTPDGVYDCERYGEMTWAFDVASGTDVEVRLYLGNQFPGASSPGDRQFNVSIQGTQVLTNYDPVAEVGHANGTMETFTVTSDGTIDIVFEVGEIENPQVNAIEIVEASDGSGDS
jgi:hypothetical protein